MRFKHKIDKTQVQAIQWNGVWSSKISKFVRSSLGNHSFSFADKNNLQMDNIIVKKGDWFIKNKLGMLFTCTDKAFNERYKK